MIETTTRLLVGLSLALMPSSMSLQAHAQGSEAAFLSNFVGRFSGNGTLQRGMEGGGRNISCKVTGAQPNRNAITIQGSCGTLIFRSGFSAHIRYDPASGIYAGLWQDRNSTSDLAGQRSGDTLVLNIERREGAAAAGASGQLTASAIGPNQYRLTVSTIGEAERPQQLDVTLHRSW